MVSRRNVLKGGIALGTAGLIGTVGSSTVGAQASFDNFVEVEGTNFVIGGESFYLNGSNNFWITHAYDGTQERIDEVLQAFSDLGLNVIRMWANGAGDDKFQYEPGEYDEDHFRVHDYVIASAAEHGIRVVPSLVDNWDHEGGMLQYADWAGERNRTTFYTDEDAKQLYRDHVETILTRENYYTGVEWREDPTIMMWELANEPRLEADEPGLDGNPEQVRADDLHREILGDWIDEMSSYFKELDSNHLVSTGSEGHFYHEGESYPDGTWGGQDFVEHHSYDSIDAASFHWYPDHWWCHDDCDDLSEVPLDRGPDWIESHAQAAADELGIPAYLGEFNVRAERPDQNQPNLQPGEGHDLSTRDNHMEQWYDAADEADLAGMMVWQLVLGSTQDHDGFQIYPDEADYIAAYSDVVDEKSGNGGTGGTDHPCEEADAASMEDVDGQTVCDLNGDGHYRDVNGDGTLTNGDVTTFFENQHTPSWDERTDLFDFTGDGNVGQADVIDLFGEI